jgi:formylglycine-generating enzyme required for sulfatase activity
MAALAADKRSIGDYRLKELHSETALSCQWLAEQVSVARLVLLDELRPECAEHRRDFLADVRAKAAVDHPMIASVYEAVDDGTHCFCAYEWLAAATLADRLKADARLPPARLAEILNRVCEAQLYHEGAAHATASLELHHIHCDDQNVVRIDNLVVAGARAANQSSDDIARLGKALRPLAADAQPGTTRITTLLAWMRGEGIDAPLSWWQVREICGRIMEQLAHPSSAPSTHPVARSRQVPFPRLTMAIVGVTALTLVLVLAMRIRPPAGAPEPQAALPESILIAAGEHPAPDGGKHHLGAFRISTHEVTIGQYAEFLEILDTLAKDGLQRAFDHPGQPPEKTSHVPQDWEALFTSAKKKSTWNQRTAGLESPVVGVDWWDASAYAEWKKASLPTLGEWHAALHAQTANPAAIPPADWLPVDRQKTDRTSAGLLGMAGSVSEWTRDPAANPANPLGERHWVIVGGSYLKPGSNALTREWTHERSLRRPDLGFRIVFEVRQ